MKAEAAGVGLGMLAGPALRLCSGVVTAIFLVTVLEDAVPGCWMWTAGRHNVVGVMVGVGNRHELQQDKQA